MADDGCVVLAQIETHLRRDGDRWVVVDDTAVDNSVRPAHVRTRTIQELLLTGPVEPPPPPGALRREAVPAAEPSRARSAELAGSTLRIGFTRPLLPATVGPGAFTVTALRSTGWARIDVTRAEPDEAGHHRDTDVALGPAVRPVRVVAHGAGPTPLLGADGQPLSGNDADRQTVRAGQDAALLIGNSDPEPE